MQSCDRNQAQFRTTQLIQTRHLTVPHFYFLPFSIATSARLPTIVSLSLEKTAKVQLTLINYKCSMHCCLQITEVFTNICDLTSDSYSNHSQKVHRCTLHSLARTCKAFHEIALDGLWITQTSFRVVVKTLPSDALL